MPFKDITRGSFRETSVEWTQKKPSVDQNKSTENNRRKASKHTLFCFMFFFKELRDSFITFAMLEAFLSSAVKHREN